MLQFKDPQSRRLYLFGSTGSIGFSGFAVFVALMALVSLACADEWQTIHNCRLIENDSNDGDSFHVEADGEERIFRLYFVDTPEAESGGYVEGRLAELAEEFGITEEESVEVI